jgi:hypothetical protein
VTPGIRDKDGDIVIGIVNVPLVTHVRACPRAARPSSARRRPPGGKSRRKSGQIRPISALFHKIYKALEEFKLVDVPDVVKI